MCSASAADRTKKGEGDVRVDMGGKSGLEDAIVGCEVTV
jgi:hypothetical protein